MLSHVVRMPKMLPALSDGRQSYTYADLACAVNGERRWLRSANVRRCALLAANGTGWVISDLALMANGVLTVPVPTYFTGAQMNHLLTDAGIEFVLTDQPAAFLTARAGFQTVGTSPHTGFSLLRREQRAAEVALPTGTLKITYTSGSTGAPKGVCLSRTAIDAVTKSLVDVTASLGVQRHMCLLPLATLLENIAGVYVPLWLGAQVHVEPTAALGMSYEGVDAKLLLEALRRGEPESLVLVPELLRLLTHARGAGWQAARPIKFIAVGGASVATELLDRAIDVGLPTFEGYGLSECGSVVCLNTPAASRRGSVGRPLPHANVRIDTNGEICVRGATMLGYAGEPAGVTDEVRTGDLGEIDADGYVYVRGRAKNMFITSMGRNVAPEWVERELTCESVIAQAMVFGEGRPHAAALLSTTGQVPSGAVNDAIARANTRLPDYARVRRWALFPEAPTPRTGLLTANGRLRRDRVLARFGSLIESLYSTPQDAPHVVS